MPFVVVDRRRASGGPPRVTKMPVICFNYRADRVRQITRVLARNSGLTKNGAARTLPGAEDLDQTIPRSEVPKRLHYVCMTQYDKQFTLPMVILPESMENLLADMLAQANLRNLRIAETEKYAHVTYFLQRWHREAVSRRGSGAGALAESGDLRPGAGDERGGDCGCGHQGDWRSGLRSGGGELCQRRYGWPLRSNWSRPSREWRPSTPAWAASIRRSKQRGGSMLITADHGNAELMVDPMTAARIPRIPRIQCRDSGE
jgi:2,3-bisphosphoglycerate-independent phosphoglycerate mutase